MKKKLFLMIFFVMLLALPMLAMAQTAISYGQVVTGEITESTPSISYTFSGNAGDLITVRMTATGGSGLDSYLRLVDPQGFDFYSDDDSGGMTNALVGPITLGETGTYTIVASSCCDSTTAYSTGTFELVVDVAQVPALTVGEPVSFELSNANPLAFFTLLNDNVPSKVARVSVEIVGGSLGTSTLSIEVRGPIGNYFYSNYTAPGSTQYAVDPVITDLAGGANVIVVRAYAEMSDSPVFAENQTIQAQLTVTEVTASPLTTDTPITGTLDDANPTAYYTFNAGMRDLLNLKGEQATDSHPINVTIYDTSGFSISGSSTINYMDGSNLGSFVIDPLRTMNEGTYYVVVNRAIYGAPDETAGKTSTFSLTLGATATPMLQAGTPATGIFDNPDVYEYVYRYQATANQTIRITVKSLNLGYAPSFDIQGEAFESPDLNIASVNAMAPGTVSYDVKLYYDGVYIIRVRNGVYYDMGEGAGEYSIQIDVVE